MSLLLKSKKRNNKTLVPDYYWGTKILLCGDNGEYSDLDDPEVFLYIEQDTTKSIYDGALAKIGFGSDVIYSQKKEFHDVGEKHRIINFDSSEVSINYHSSNEEINIDILKEFQHSINYDSVYIKKYNRVKYNLIYQENNKCLVSIRYEDYGKRFYFDVFE